MKPLFNLLRSAWILLTVTACATAISPTSTPSPTSSPVASGSDIRGVFEGVTPCSAADRPLPQIPADTNCEMMIWKFTLHQDAETGTPTTYTLTSSYGVPQSGTLGIVGGGTEITMEGKWASLTGTKLDPDAVVYQLNPDTPETAVSFVKLNDDMLHVLASDQTLLVGNPGWSYTLNRTDNRASPSVIEPGEPAGEPTRPPLPSMPAGATVLGAFEGRTPCHPMLFELTTMASYPNCLKFKLRVTLYQDQTTGAPTTYLAMGTRAFHEGVWTIAQGTADDPEAVVYQLLHLGNLQPLVSFLKADDNHLFLLDRELNLLAGNALFSYTLSRVEQDDS